MSEYNYENDYNEALREAEGTENYYRTALEEIRRLRSVARNYSAFYNKIKDAFDKQDWEIIKQSLKEFE